MGVTTTLMQISLHKTITHYTNYQKNGCQPPAVRVLVDIIA